MRLASYNIRKAVGLDWKRDPERIADVLAELDADVVVLQEADRRIGARAGVLPLPRLDAMGYVIADISVRPLSHGWHGNVILIRTPMSADQPRRVELPAVEPRGAVAAKIAPVGITVIGVHLGLTPGMRRQQLAHLVASAEGPTVIAGDFNERKADLQLPLGEVVTPGLTFHSSWPRAALDRFILFGVTASSARVHVSALARKASDHLPVVLELDREA
ncbi:endonuclease/exonuclease/phosphatase family protein [Algicella marina]|uniref:Endonuclease n=1 Tax=Algicella marina TaxID=2683284 RepID=A0A6P1T4R8_9RHOB|nr:endonuclease/exonuclease/phosphatase family protein [Algicella marina]QHQ35542.1 endonuclease [Algicella marina]